MPGRLTVAELFALFLEAVEAEKDEDTFRDYQRWCTEFAKAYGNKPVRAVTKAEAADFKLRMMKATYVRGKQPPRPYSPKTVNHALIALRRAFNWAVETDRLPPGRNPFAGSSCSRPRAAGGWRPRTSTRPCCGTAPDDAFRDVLVAMRHTSARPQDIYSLTWPMVDWDDRMWVLHDHKAAGRPGTRSPGSSAWAPRSSGCCGGGWRSTAGPGTSS